MQKLVASKKNHPQHKLKEELNENKRLPQQTLHVRYKYKSQ